MDIVRLTSSEISKGPTLMPKLHIQFTLFSAFYSPLISTMTGNFLTEEGFDYEWSIAKPGTSALNALREGKAHVVQSTISQGFTSLEKGEKPKARHFALINNLDGFSVSYTHLRAHET